MLTFLRAYLVKYCSGQDSRVCIKLLPRLPEAFLCVRNLIRDDLVFELIRDAQAWWNLFLACSGKDFR